MNSETYERFLRTLNENELRVWTQSALIDHAVQVGLRSELTEVETLKVIILSMLNVYNDDVAKKLDEIMRNPAPVLIQERK